MKESLLLKESSFWYYWCVFFGIILVRYLLIAGGAHLLFYQILKKSLIGRGITLTPPMENSLQREIALSVLSAVVFAFGAALITLSYRQGITLLYTQINAYGILYLGVSYVLTLILQDTYFYFTHRLFHYPLFFKFFHKSHHISKHPTPWTSFAFDPLEALVQILFLIGIVFIIPLHYIVLGAVLITMTVWAVLNHLGFKLFPSTKPYHWFGRWFIGPTHHLLHHRKYKVHYGLYFTFWDKLLNTNDRPTTVGQS